MIMNGLFIFVFFIEMLITLMFFSTVSERKYALWLTVLFGAVLFEAGAFINNHLISTVWLNVLFSFLVNFIFAKVCFKMKPVHTGFYCLLLVAVSTFLEMIVVFLISSLTKLYISDYKSETMLLVVEIIVSKVLYFITAMILARFAGKNKDVKTVKIPISFFLFPVITSVSVIGFWYISLKEEIEFNHQIILAVISVMLFLATVVIFFAFQSNAQKENELMVLQREKEKIDTETAYCEILERQNTNLRIYAHDAKNHLTAIRSLNEDPQIDTYISKMINNLEEYSNVSHSGNQTLDVMINKYLTECSINEIEFHFDVRNNNLKGMEHYDLVGMFSNLLDNAKEAAVKSAEKRISLETDLRNNYSVIIVENSCDCEPKFDRSGNPVSTKDNSLLHGYGLKSVKRIVKKYNGDYEFVYDAENKKFIVTIMVDLD